MTQDQEQDRTTHQEDADKLLASAQRMRWIAIFAVICLMAVGLCVLGVISFNEHRQIQALQKIVAKQAVVIAKQASQLDASCSFYRDVGTAPLPVSAPKGRQPSELGVRIVVHSRVAFTGQNCPGKLPAPGPGLLKWASLYKVGPVPR